MKLFRLTALIQFILTGLILLLAGSMIFKLLIGINTTETYEKLLVNKNRIVVQLKKGVDVSELKPIIEIAEVKKTEHDTLFSSSRWIFDPIENEMEHFMEVCSIETIGNKKYRISVRQVVLENHDYTKSIFDALILTFSILLISLLFINYLIARLTWRAFYKNLDVLKSFSLEKDMPIKLLPSKIKEFRVLNSTILSLADRVQKDYRAVKEFSEYASHEIQTPLAIIRVKQEEMLQDPDLSPKNAQLIQHSLDAIHRLTRLNKTLLLLTKIDNQQFSNVQQNDLGIILHKTILEFDEMLQQRGLKLSTNFENEVIVHADTSLLEMLLSNLMSNAIKHNNEQGTININLDSRKLEFSNSGRKYTKATSELFDRFSKGDPSSSSLGLGLSIAERICKLYGWTITYTYENNLHFVRIHF